MTGRFPRELPARLVQAGGLEGWGRLERLSPAGATLSTLATLARDERVELWLEVGGERFEALWARVVHLEPDADGFTRAELDFVLPTDRRRLAVALADVLSR